jgi:DNA-binding transcriptional LysR family regulator
MMKLDGVAAFVATAEAGSISAAARRLGHAKSVVSERLAELERSLGTRLIQRTTRKLSLTEDGQTFLQRARRILFEAAEGVAEMAERRGTLVGALRISAPVSFGVLHLGPAIYTFLAEHRGIDLTLDLDDRFVDAAADGFDAVVRHGAVDDTRLVAKRLATSRRVLVASPDYLARHGAPCSLAELEQHCGILYANRDADWRFAMPDGWDVVRPRAALRVNNGLVMRDAAIAGLGLTLLPTFFIHAALATGALVTVDIGVEAEGAELYIAHPRDRSASAKIAALTESLQTSFGDPPYWDRSTPVA